jgi:hypothetical protein
MSPNCSQIITNDIQYFNRSMENEKWCIFICVNRIIPVPDVSFGLLFQSNAQLFPAFQVGMAEQRTLLSAWVGSWANRALA